MFNLKSLYKDLQTSLKIFSLLITIKKEQSFLKKVESIA